MSDIQLTCPACHKALPVEGAAFCPFCGAPLAANEAPLPTAAKEALAAADKTDDPVKKYKLLTAASEAYPGCLTIEREILHLGKLHLRDARRPTYDVIKCYLLQAYLSPAQLSAEKRSAMRFELFEDEQLKRCQALASDPNAFTRNYLERLSTEFIHLFLEGSNQYMHRIFGFSVAKNSAKLLAAPAAAMLKQMELDQGLTPEQRDMLMSAFYRAFARQMDNQTEFLRETLLELDCTMPV